MLVSQDTNWCRCGLARCLKVLSKPDEADQICEYVLQSVPKEQTEQNIQKAVLCNSAAKQVKGKGSFGAVLGGALLGLSCCSCILVGFISVMSLALGTTVPLAVFNLLMSLGAGLFGFIFLRSSWLTPVKGPKEKFGFQLSEPHHGARRLAFRFQLIYALTLILVLFDMHCTIYFCVSAIIMEFIDYDELEVIPWGHVTVVLGWSFLELMWFALDYETLSRRWSLTSAPIRVCRPVALHLHIYLSRQVRSWDEMSWPLVSWPFSLLSDLFPAGFLLICFC